MADNESENPPADNPPAANPPADNPPASQSPQNALLALSTTEAPGDAKKAVIYNCIVVAFFDQGFPEINDQAARIVWSTIDDTVIMLLGNNLTNCITGKGFHSPALAPMFATLKEMNQVTMVSDLVTGIAAMVTP